MLIINANVVFSCLLRGKALAILFQLYDKEIKVVSPQYLTEEVEGRLDKLAKQSQLSRGALSAFALILFSEFIRILPKSEYEQFIEDAKQISPHLKDATYFALSLAFDKAPIWSRELRLKRQKTISVLSDDEVIEYFGLTGR
jgi:predicted nucleic acid-binding protein